MRMLSVVTERAPKAIGPYSQAMVCGQFIFVSGQLGLDPVSGQLKEDVQTQTLQSLNNLKTILEMGGSDLQHVLRTTVYLTDMNDYPIINKIYEQFFEEPYPARSVVEVGALPREGLVEIEIIAVLKNDQGN